LLKQLNIDQLFILGYTARHAQELGFRTAIVRDLSCRITPEGAQAALDRITDNHGLIINSSEVLKDDRASLSEL